ncbi:SipW-dependent-type signal peptide-containing protein [Luethyella okanaganae]|uniref:SipW-dependent-type signal peptide-containing protein n=1 Tax=Luethyella okanaganae TaxID=69372 RepID=A0ABW1VCH9_9MICO
MDQSELFSSPPRRGPSRKFKAVLAGGLALGVGAAITLAAWNDSEFASGTFAAGSFEIEGSTDGTTFGDHEPAASAATLAFALDANKLAPDEPVYAAFAVQLKAGSTNAASVSIAASSAAPIAGSLNYSLVSTATFGCDAAAFAGGVALVTDAATTTSSAAGIIPLVAVSTPVDLCFRVTPSTSLPPGTASGSVLWEFTAVSTTPIP